MKNKDKKKRDMETDKARSINANDVFQTITAFFAYLGCIGIALVVMYYLNGTFGILIATALGCAFIISVAVTLIVMRSVRIDFKLDKSSVSKGEQLNCIITLSKKIMIPTPIIDIHISSTPQLSKKTDLCSVSLAGQRINTVKIPLTAKYSGAAKISIDKVMISDYLGIFRFRLKSNGEYPVMKISVYPNIPDVPIQTDFLKTAVLFSNNDNDDEEETNETAMGQTGQPGYDHREYYPGDPIKRINWKLSSKRDVYMIRLDERVAESGQMFFLDVPKLPENDLNLSVRDNVIEGILAVFTMLVREGRETVFFFSEKNIWRSMDIHTEADIYAIQELLADLEPSTVKNSVPLEIINAGKAPICFTTATADFSDSAERIVSESPDVLMICAASSGLSKITSEMWSISEEFEIKKQL